MIKKIFSIFLCSLFQLAFAQSSQTNLLVLGPNGLGELKLGMHWQKDNAVDRMLHFPTTPPTFSDACVLGNLTVAQYTSTDPSDDGAFLSKKLGLASISSHFKEVLTPEGIGIGSTVKQVKKAYPDLDVNATTGEQEWPKVRVPGNAHAFYQIEFAHGKVSALTLALNEQDCFG